MVSYMYSTSEDWSLHPNSLGFLTGMIVSSRSRAMYAGFALVMSDIFSPAFGFSSKMTRLFHYQAQASDQFLATTKLATHKAICLKTKKINKSNIYFLRFLATNNKYISVIARIQHI